MLCFAKLGVSNLELRCPMSAFEGRLCPSSRLLRGQRLARAVGHQSESKIDCSSWSCFDQNGFCYWLNSNKGTRNSHFAYLSQSHILAIFDLKIAKLVKEDKFCHVAYSLFIFLVLTNLIHSLDEIIFLMKMHLNIDHLDCLITEYLGTNKKIRLSTTDLEFHPKFESGNDDDIQQNN